MTLVHRPGIDERDLDAKTRDDALNFVEDHPGTAAKQVAIFGLRLAGLHRPADLAAHQDAELGVSPTRRHLSTAIFVIVFLLALVGVAGIVTRRSVSFGPWWFWLAPVLLLVSTVILVGSPRYRAPLDPFLILLATVPVVEAWRRWREPVQGPEPPADTRSRREQTAEP